MKAFTFNMPTEIVFGRDAELQTARLVKKYGGSKVFVVFGGGSVVKSGLLKKITDLLEESGIAYLTFGGAKPNPILAHARDGVKYAIDFGADFILAVGGGSVIDTAKAIAHGAKNPDVDIWRFWKREAELTKTLPVGAVVTISAAGSETSASAVITNAETGEKRGLSTELNRPYFAVMNPVLTYTLPKYQIACGVVDIMMHTLDRYFTQDSGNETTDEIAGAILRTVIRNGPAALKNPEDYNAMSELMWCGSLSHNGITGLGRTMDFSIHQLGMELGGRFDIAHGATLSAVWGSWADYCKHVKPALFAKYAKDIWGIEESDTERAASCGIAATVKYFQSLEMPTCFTELEIGIQPDNVLEEMADSCVFHGKRTVGNFKPLNINDVYNIFKMANR